MKSHLLRLVVLAMTPGLLLASYAWAVPAPIVQDEQGVWFIDTEGVFPTSNVSLELRRLAFIPDPSPQFPTFRARPNKLTFAPGDNRLFLADAGLWFTDDPPGTGVVYAIEPDGSDVKAILNVGQALDDLLGDDGSVVHLFGNQGGLRSVAFHPLFDQPNSGGYGKVYTTQLQRRPLDISSLIYVGPSVHDGNNQDGVDGVLAEWTAVFDTHGRLDFIEPTSYRELFRIATPDAQHPIKEVSFNYLANPGDEDFGLLYLLQGDGVESATEGTGQDPTTALGKVIRINPLPTDDATYQIPPTNPFVDDPGVLDEIFSLGHRNIHTISFARDEQCNPLIFVSEIGHGSVEEINLVVPGADFGWGQREGTFTRVDFSNIDDLPPDDAKLGFSYPVAQFGHHPRTSPHAIAGGYLIDNDSQLDGYYFFGDFTTGHRPILSFTRDQALAAVQMGPPVDLSPAPVVINPVTKDHDGDPHTPPVPKVSYYDIVNDEPTYAPSGRTDLRFGHGPRGEMYLLNKRNGWVYLVVNSLPDPVLNFDADGDGSMDLDDVPSLLECVTGPFGRSIGSCDRCGRNRFDLDGDHDFDLVEVQELQNSFGQ